MWGAVAGAVVCAALAAAVRPASYDARMLMVPAAAGGQLPPGDPTGYIEARLREPALAAGLATHLPNVTLRPERIAVGPYDAAAQRVPVVVHGSPTGARALADALQPQLVVASQRELAARASADRRRLHGALPFANAAERRRLQRRIAALDAEIRSRPAALLTAARATAPPPRGVDRAIDLLPGPVPGRPHPVWAALAALAALAACVTALRTRGP
jgi:hypothetical protein